MVYALAGAGAGIDSLRDPTGRSAGAWSSVARVRDASHVARGRCRPASIACDQNPGGAFAGVGGCWVDGSHLLMGIGCETLPNSHRSGGRHELYIKSGCDLRATQTCIGSQIRGCARISLPCRLGPRPKREIYNEALGCSGKVAKVRFG